MNFFLQVVPIITAKGMYAMARVKIREVSSFTYLCFPDQKKKIVYYSSFYVHNTL